MKYLVKFFVVTFLLLICTYASAKQKVAYMDLKFILNNSMAGKVALGKITDRIKENQKKIFDKENELKKEEIDLLTKKTVLTKEEYKKQTEKLRQKVIDYQKQRRTSQDLLTRMYAEARKALIKKIDPILDAYMTENDISLLIDKKNIPRGSADFDSTNVIVENLNKELPSLSLK